MKKISFSIVVLSSLFMFSSCKDEADAPKPNEENELITKIHLHLIGENDSTKLGHAEWVDLTPDDPSGRSIDTLRLDTGTVYLGEIELSDESKSPVVDITEEVEEEKDDHLFIYRQDPLESTVKFTVERTDRDSKNLPVGLKFKFITKSIPGLSRLQVMLKHQPGIKDGSDSPGDTDLDVWFPVKIQ